MIDNFIGTENALNILVGNDGVNETLSWTKYQLDKYDNKNYTI